MATGYTLTVGYNSSCHDDVAWNVILDAVKSVRYIELLDVYQGPMSDEKQEVLSIDMAKRMTILQGTDGAVTISEKGHCILLLASGGGIVRKMKEHMRRAFIQCVMRRADKQGVDVDVNST